MSSKPSRPYWKADSKLIDESLEVLQAGVKGPTPPPTHGSAKDEPSDEERVVAVGRLVLMGANQELSRAMPAILDPATLVRNALEQHDFSVLEEAGESICDLSEELGSDPNEVADASRERLLEALEARDEVEFLLAGVEALLGETAVLSDDQRTYLYEFEYLVRPMLWRLVPLNEQRAEALTRIAPSSRARFWWRHQGSGVPPDAIESLSVAAELLRCFPEARDKLESLMQTDQALVQLTRASAREGVARGESVSDAGLEDRQVAASPIEMGSFGAGREGEAERAAELQHLARQIANMDASALTNASEQVENVTPLLRACLDFVAQAAESPADASVATQTEKADENSE